MGAQSSFYNTFSFQFSRETKDRGKNPSTPFNNSSNSPGVFLLSHWFEDAVMDVHSLKYRAKESMNKKGIRSNPQAIPLSFNKRFLLAKTNIPQGSIPTQVARSAQKGRVQLEGN
ncbi:hypothetical protein JTE90_021311 [Oedothorax gibbosus]|uniref:Uncharacterized protein n=1 Tax=Oedothorax gibbosus TaxID=931172 RepID=A0AAV6VPA8_9ARAC|nr:hypothetical protein JTE90_021311 [Oedothorax gibbosus]